MSKENISKEANTYRSKGHPSNETECQSYRPSIKVGYKVIHNNAVERKFKHRVEQIVHAENRVQRKKFQEPKALDAGNFVNCQYVKNDDKQIQLYHRKAVAQSRDKYQSGNGVKESLSIEASRRTVKRSSRNQSCKSFSSCYSRQKSVLPSYQQVGIKDIMEYHHAGNYREIPITQKCTKSTVQSRLKTFSQMHEFDFRKRPQFLR